MLRCSHRSVVVMVNAPVPSTEDADHTVVVVVMVNVPVPRMYDADYF